MSGPLVLDPAARADIEDAVRYYEGERVGLGLRLHEALTAALARIEEAPQAAAVIYRSRTGHDVRAARVWRFPYRVVFVELEGEVRVVAAAHLKRAPGYWHGRVPP